MSGLPLTLLSPNRIPEVKDCGGGWRVALVALDLTECGWLLAAVCQGSRPNDLIAWRLREKVRAAAIALGVDWSVVIPEGPKP